MGNLLEGRERKRGKHGKGGSQVRKPKIHYALNIPILQKKIKIKNYPPKERMKIIIFVPL